MDKKPPVVISIGYGRHLFVPENGERARMMICAKETKQFHMIIFTRRHDGLLTQTVGEKLSLHPTRSISRFTMLYDAYQLGVQIIKAHSADRVIVTTQDPFETGMVGYWLKRRFGVHLTIQEHADAFSLDFWKKESFGNQVRFLVGKYLIKKADVIRVVSARIAKTIRTMYPCSTITMLPVAVDPTPFLASVSNVHKNHSNEFWFLSVARFVPQKNIPLLIRAFAAAYRENPKLRLRIVGMGPEQGRIETDIQKFFPTDAVPILIESWSSDVSSLMQEADAFVLSSNYEGWARVLIEAILARLPIVTTAVGCAGEVVQHGLHGLVVPVNEQEALTNAFLQLSTDTNLYHSIARHLAALDTTKIPGVGLKTYGVEWVKTLG